MDTIDMTPEGLKTPEGQARVTGALEALADVNAECANLLADMYDSGGDDAELLGAVKDALAHRRAVTEAFLSALSGR